MERPTLRERVLVLAVGATLGGMFQGAYMAEDLDRILKHKPSVPETIELKLFGPSSADQAALFAQIREYLRIQDAYSQLYRH